MSSPSRSTGFGCSPGSIELYPRLAGSHSGPKAIASRDSTGSKSHRCHESVMNQPSAAFTFLGCHHKQIPMTISTERRSFIQGAGFVAAAASTTTLAASTAFAQTNQPSGVKTMPYQAKPLSLDPKSIKGISEKVLVSHYENNYVGAVKRLNAIGAQLAELDFAKASNFMINGLKREELVAANSMILHEIYFDGLGGGANASGALAEAISRDFGSVERWRAEFAAMGKAEGGGSGG